jgi:hypothetical protein
VVLGYASAAPDTLAAFGDVPVIVVGGWGALPASASVFILSNPDIPAQMTVSPTISVTEAARLDAPIIGGEVFALEQFPKLRPALDGIRILSSGTPPDAEFAARYRGDDPFAPAPGLLATLTYDAFRLLLEGEPTSRPALLDLLSRREYTGLNGVIRFEDGWWADAPIHRYTYDEENQLQTES